MKTAVIYARYSSDSQTEQSIEGQLRVCQEYARANEILIVDTYIDRAMTGTNDLRPDFQRMIKDSGKRQWNFVIVYKLDRFSRDKYETTIHKHTLKDNGVKLISAMENIPDSPEGIILESLLEGMNQYYSAELSQKVHRGLNESYRKGNFTGGAKIYGYDVVDKKNVINPIEGEIVKEIFTKYAQGYTAVAIANDLKMRGIRTKKGKYIDSIKIYKVLVNTKYNGKIREEIRETQEVLDNVNREIERKYKENDGRYDFKKRQSSDDFRVGKKINYDRTGGADDGILQDKSTGDGGATDSKGRGNSYQLKTSKKKFSLSDDEDTKVLTKMPDLDDRTRKQKASDFFKNRKQLLRDTKSGLGPIADGWTSVQIAFVNEQAAIERELKRQNVKNYEALTQTARAAKNAAEEMVAGNQYSADGKYLGKGLGKILAPIKAKGKEYTADFYTYLAEKHNIDRRRADYIKRVTELEKANPDFKKYDSLSAEKQAKVAENPDFTEYQRAKRIAKNVKPVTNHSIEESQSIVDEYEKTRNLFL